MPTTTDRCMHVSEEEGWRATKVPRGNGGRQWCDTAQSSLKLGVKLASVLDHWVPPMSHSQLNRSENLEVWPRHLHSLGVILVLLKPDMHICRVYFSLQQMSFCVQCPLSATSSLHSISYNFIVSEYLLAFFTVKHYPKQQHMKI